MEVRKARMIVNKAGAGNSTFRATLPTSWIREMKLDEDNRDLLLSFDGEKITIQNIEEMTKMEKENLFELIEIKEGKEKMLIAGDFKGLLEYLTSNENRDLTTWVLDEDPEMETPNLENVENIEDLRYELNKIDMSWWTLEVREIK